MKKYNVAVVGATGAVGREMLGILQERDFPVGNIRALASSRTAGEKMSVFDMQITVQELDENSFKGIDIALFSAGGQVSKDFAPIAAKGGTVVVDNSSAFRMDDDVPLVVPEINPQDLRQHKNIIANPNCSTIQMLLPLKPIHDKYRIKRIVVSTYQAVSGTGKDAMDELFEQSKLLSAFKSEDIIPVAYPKQIAFNLLPHIDVFEDNGYTREEIKMVNETQKILGDDTILVSPTCVRVPVFISHSESVNIETEKPMDQGDVREMLKTAPGVEVLDDPDKWEYPTPLEVSGEDNVFVGRIRKDLTVENGLNMWIVGDNLKKGAALNAVQIAEELIRENLVQGRKD